MPATATQLRDRNIGCAKLLSLTVGVLLYGSMPNMARLHCNTVNPMQASIGELGYN